MGKQFDKYERDIKNRNLRKEKPRYVISTNDNQELVHTTWNWWEE